MSTYNITSEDKEFEKLLNKNRVSLNETFTKNFDVQEKTLNLITTSIKHADFNSFNNNKLIWNAAGYINIISYDLKVIVKNLILAKGEWEKRYFIRQLALLAYEGMNDILRLLGKDFRKSISMLSNYEDLVSELKSNISKLNDFKLRREISLKNIRNVSIAHRDQSSLEQLKIIYNLTWSEGVGIGTDFDQILNDLGIFLQKVINKSVSEFEELYTKAIE